MKDIKKLRRMADLTQCALARRCGVSRMRLSLAECGQIKLRPEEETAVRKVLVSSIERREVQIRVVLSRGNET